MALALIIRNRQKRCVVDLRLLRRIVRALFVDVLQITEADLSFFLVAAPEMTRLNETFLHHAGSTDVITFDYTEQSPRKPQHPLHGEIFICVDEAVAQARRFRTNWQAEVVRYIVHGTLHLLGFYDQRAVARRQMKREENRLLRILATRFRFQNLARR